MILEKDIIIFQDKKIWSEHEELFAKRCLGIYAKWYNSNYNNITQSKNVYSNGNTHETAKGSIQGSDFNKPGNPDNPFDLKDINGKKTFVDESILKVDKSPNKYKNLDDKIIEDMQSQINIFDSLKGKSIDEITTEEWDKVYTPQHKESVRKLRELLDI